MSQDEELRGVLNQTASEISRLSDNPRTWLSWMVYLLDRLEQQTMDGNPNHKQSYKEMLAGLQDAIRNRLRTGGW
jgi:hypothetical protein